MAGSHSSMNSTGHMSTEYDGPACPSSRGTSFSQLGHPLAQRKVMIAMIKALKWKDVKHALLV